MHRADKAPEPSMEEILASIRKIIAEEPIGSRPGPTSHESDSDAPLPATKASDPASRADAPALPMPSRNQEGSYGPPYSVEDALADLMDDSSQRRADPAAGKDDFAKPQGRPAPPEEDSRPGWLFGRQASPSSAQPQAGSSPAPARSPGGSLLGQLGSLRESPERAPIEGGNSGAKPAAAPRQAEADSLFGRQREAGRPGPADFPTLPQGSSHEVPRPAAPRVPTREAGFASPRSEQSSGPGSLPGASTPGARPASAIPMPVGRSPEPGADAATQSDAPQREAAADTVAKSAQAPAGMTERQSSPASAAADRSDGSARERSTEAASAAGQSTGSHREAPKKPAAPSATQASPQSAAARTLEDTVAELLRPMLREWLDANMPRIVEKALRVELASSAKGKERSDG